MIANYMNALDLSHDFAFEFVTIDGDELVVLDV